MKHSRPITSAAFGAALSLVLLGATLEPVAFAVPVKPRHDTAPAVSHAKPVPSHAVARIPDVHPASAVSAAVAPSVAPVAADFAVDLSTGQAQRLGSSGLTLRATSGIGTVAVSVLDKATAGRLGYSGLAFRIRRTDGRTAATDVAVTVDAAVLNGLYGADYARRAGFVVAADTAGARVRPLRTTRSTGQSRTVTAVTSTSTVLATTATTSGGTGDFGATTLSPSSSWQVSPQTGSFTWNYPVRVPPAAAGPEPSVSLSYDSGSVDGETGSTNNQPSAVGDGWSLAAGGFIERSYVPCSSDGVSTSGDECWSSSNASLSFAGHSGMLLKDGAGVWHLQNDDGTKVEKLTGAVNGDTGTAGVDGVGEYWKLTTTDGTQYFFGQNRLPGWVSGKPVTQSTWTVPVFGNNTGEPCHASTFAASSCTQAWRWNLDYVLDTHDNSAAYYYTTQSNSYYRNSTTTTSYIRAGDLARIDYGMRAGSELSTPAPQQVLFTSADRCSPNTTCDSAHPTSWPDVPWDQSCTSGTCSTHTSPSFFTTKRLAGIATQYYSGTSYVPVESWGLTQTYPDPGDGTSAALWLSSIQHKGLVGGTVTMPDTTFTSKALANRAFSVDGLPSLNKHRISSIRTDTSATLTINYLAAECSSTNHPAAAESNVMRCYPQWWTPPGMAAKLDWFNKYPIASMSVDAGTGGTADAIQSTFYDYSAGKPGWRYQTSPLVPANKRTWSVWAGYDKVSVSHGDLNYPAARQTTTSLYFQGLDQDRATPSGGVKSIKVTASDGSTVDDSLWFAGQVRETIDRSGVAGPTVTDTFQLPWASGVTATDGLNQAYRTGVGDVIVKTALSAGGYRNTETKTDYDGLGRPAQVTDFGDTSTATDDRCTRTSYADNLAAGLTSLPADVSVTVGACTTTPTYPQDAIGETRTSYDGQAYGLPPTDGDATTTEIATGYTGSTASTATWLTTQTESYDALGRSTSSTDALGHQTTTAYTPAAAGPTTGIQIKNAKQWAISTSTVDPAWGETTSTVDENGHTTSATYDALGRRTQVWLPDRSAAANPTSPSYSFAYTVTAGAPVAIATTALDSVGNTTTSYTLYDGLLRQRQIQQVAEDNVAASTPTPPAPTTMVTDTWYDKAGRVSVTTDPYPVNTAPSAVLWQPVSQGLTSIAAATETLYDGADRPTDRILRAYGVEKWRSITSYGGDHTSLTPPAGGTATSTYTDARGNTTQLLQYHAGTPTGPADTTSYRYDNADRLSGMTDPAGNSWSWTYDLLGRKTDTVDPDKGAMHSDYDNAGNLTSTRDARNTTLSFTYDELDRKTGEYLGTPATGTQLAAWSYDPAGNLGQLASSTRFDGGNSYVQAITGYDAAYRPLGTTTTLPNLSSLGALAALSYTTTTAYNPDGTVASQTDPAAGGLLTETIKSTYTRAGHLASYRGKTSYLAATNYDTDGSLLQATHYNGVNTLYDTYGYEDGSHRLTHLKSNTNGTGNTVAMDRTYSYDNAGDVTAISDASTAAGTDNQCFGYDYLQRLTTAWTPLTAGSCATAPTTGALGGAAPYWSDYTYDLTGNRTSATSHSLSGGPDSVDTYAYPAAGQPNPHFLTGVTHTGAGTGTDTYTADQAGNTATRPGQSLSWDAEGRLSDLTSAGQGQHDVYDADGALLVQSDPTATVVFLGDTELRSTPGSSVVSGTRSYSALTGVIAVRTASTAGTTTTLNWQDTDPQGTALVTVSPTTNQITVRHLTPFGTSRDAAAVAWPDQRGFLDKPVDAFAGLTQLGVREYDPALGRFLSVDPIGEPLDPQQNNGYSYAHNNPVTLSDPTGLRPAGDKDDTDAGDWGKITTCPSCSHPAPRPSPSEGWTTYEPPPAPQPVVHHKKCSFVCHLGSGLKTVGKVAADVTGVTDVVNCVTHPGIGSCAMAIATVASYAVPGAGVALRAAREGIAVERLARAGLAADRLAADGGATLGKDAARACLNSFTGDTPVTLADGSKKRIDRVKVGDAVLATDPETGQTAAEPVVQLIRHGGQHQMVLITLADGSVLDSTAGHPIWDATTGRFTEAGSLNVGDTIETATGARIAVTGLTDYSADLTAYNLQIDQIHTYYAGTTPVLVHNSCTSAAEVVNDASAVEGLTASQVDDLARNAGYHVEAGNARRANPATRYYAPGTNKSVGFRVLPQGVVGQGGVKAGPYLRYFGGSKDGFRVPLSP